MVRLFLQFIPYVCCLIYFIQNTQTASGPLPLASYSLEIVPGLRTSRTIFLYFCVNLFCAQGFVFFLRSQYSSELPVLRYRQSIGTFLKWRKSLETIINSFCSLPYDKPTVSSKASSPQSSI